MARRKPMMGGMRGGMPMRDGMMGRGGKSVIFDSDNLMAFSHCIAMHTQVHLGVLPTSVSMENCFCFVFCFITPINTYSRILMFVVHHGS